MKKIKEFKKANKAKVNESTYKLIKELENG